MADYVSSYTGAQIDSAIGWVNANRQSATDTDAIFYAGSNSAPDFLGGNSTFDAWIENIINATALGRVRLIQDANGGGIVIKNGTSVLGIGVVLDNLVYGPISNVNIDSDSDADIERELYEQGILVKPSLYALTSLSNASLTKSFGASGYYKAPDGMMFCWGSSRNQTTSFSVYYATAFYTTPYCVYTTSTGFGDSAIESAGAAVVGTTYFTMKPRYIKRLSNGQSEYGNSGNTFMWLAIGRWK
jgi:hypothetical protein